MYLNMLKFDNNKLIYTTRTGSKCVLYLHRIEKTDKFQIYSCIYHRIKKLNTFSGYPSRPDHRLLQRPPAQLGTEPRRVSLLIKKINVLNIKSWKRHARTLMKKILRIIDQIYKCRNEHSKLII